MQKFKFKLDALLKVREFKEKKVKIELGDLLKQMNAVEDKIRLANQAIDETYEAQETFMNDSSQGRMLQFFPYFIQGKKEDIKNQENLLWALRKKYDAKILELAEARGQVKIMENFKENKKVEWTKVKNKKEQEDIDELINIRRLGINE